MSFYNTGNPVPSIDPRDLDDNAKHIDEIVNSTLPTFTDRLGAERLTLAGLESEVSPALSLRGDLADPSDVEKGASLVGYRGLTVDLALDTAIDVRFLASGCKGDGLVGSGPSNLLALQTAFAIHGSGTYHFKRSPHGDNHFILSDSWNLYDQHDTFVVVDAGVTVETVSPTTYGHTICIGAGSLIGGTSEGRVRNVGFAGGGSIIASGSGTADNGIGFLRVADAFVIGMDIPTADRKAITFQVNDPTGDPGKFNGNISILDCKIGVTGWHAVTIEGGCDGTVFVDGVTCDEAGLDFLHFTGSNSPATDISRVILGTNVCNLAGGKGVYAFRVLDLETGNARVVSAVERGLDISQCGDVTLRGKAHSTGSWGARISSCTGDITITDGFKCTTSAATFSALDLNVNTKDAIISSATIGDGSGTYAITATGKSAHITGAALKSGTAGSLSGVAPTGRFLVDGVYKEAVDGAVYKITGSSILLPANSATPDVTGGPITVVKSQNTVATLYTNFLGGHDGQILVFVSNDTNTTIQDNANIKLAGSVDWVPSAGNDTNVFVRSFGAWIRIGGSDN